MAANIYFLFRAFAFETATVYCFNGPVDYIKKVETEGT